MCPAAGGLAGEISEGVLKANQGCDSQGWMGELEDDGTRPGIKVIGNKISYDNGKERKALAEGDVLPEHDQMGLAVDLGRVFRSGEHDGGVVVCLMAEDEGAEEK